MHIARGIMVNFQVKIYIYSAAPLIDIYIYIFRLRVLG